MDADDLDEPSDEPTDEPPAPPPVHDPPPCLNCGTPVDSNFCPDCGQKNAPRRVRIGHFVREVLGEAFELDGRVFRTLVPFLFRPGFLTREYNAGRRARYVSPFRLFLACTLLWVASGVVSSYVLPDEVPVLSEDAPGDPVGGREAGEDLGTQGVRFVVPDEDDGLDGKPLGAAETQDAPPPEILAPIAEGLEEFDKLDTKEQGALFLAAGIQTLPKAALVLVPVLALLLKILHLGTRRYYVEHLAFALHVSAFGFLLFAGSFWVGEDSPLGWAGPLVALIYLWVALAKAYQARWWSAGFRAMTIVLVYGMTLTLTTVVATMLTVLL